MTVLEEIFSKEANKFKPPLEGKDLETVIVNTAIEFAKYHVTEALKAASENQKI